MSVEEEGRGSKYEVKKERGRKGRGEGGVCVWWRRKRKEDRNISGGGGIGKGSLEQGMDGRKERRKERRREKEGESYRGGTERKRDISVEEGGKGGGRLRVGSDGRFTQGWREEEEEEGMQW